MASATPLPQAIPAGYTQYIAHPAPPAVDPAHPCIVRSGTTLRVALGYDGRVMDWAQQDVPHVLICMPIFYKVEANIWFLTCDIYVQEGPAGGDVMEALAGLPECGFQLPGQADGSEFQAIFGPSAADVAFDSLWSVVAENRDPIAA